MDATSAASKTSGLYCKFNNTRFHPAGAPAAPPPSGPSTLKTREPWINSKNLRNPAPIPFPSP